MSPRSWRAVVVMARRPDPGTTKTRLQPMLEPEDAARLYEAFLRDTIDLARSVTGADPIIAIHPADAVGYFGELAPGVELVPQIGDGLGHRLDQVIGQLLDRGYHHVAAIGSDSPTLPAERIAEAFDRLDAETADVVLGPADDGGYYLIAVTDRPGPLVTSVVMSTPDVLTDTLEQATAAGLRVALLDPWYDVDEPADLLRLRHQLDASPAAVGRHSRALLASLPCARRPTIGAVIPALDEADSVAEAATIGAVIPALDEADSVAEAVRRTMAEGVDPVIVVDNGSTDSTAEAAAGEGAVVVSEPRRGYGYACAAGAEEAMRRGCDVIVFLDADLSSPPEELPSLLEPLLAGRADLVLGSRVLGRIGEGAMPAHQRAGNALSAWLMRRLYGIEVTDLGPFRAIRADLLTSLDLREMTFGWPTEMTVKAARAHCRIEEVPVSWLRRAAGRSKVSGTVRGSILAARYILGVTVRYAAPMRR